MTTLLDGPAKGQTLMLKRSPVFLRVTEEQGKWDALDQPLDAPKDGEICHAYQIEGEPGMCHVKRTGGGGFFTIANYSYVIGQPMPWEMRDNKSWHEWCLKRERIICERRTGDVRGT